MIDDTFDYKACRNLVADIILKALKDLDNPSFRKDALRFIMSDQCRMWCEHLDINIEVLRERICEVA